MANGKRGRKPKYTPELLERLVEALKEGVTIADACEYAGIDDATYYRWLQEKSEFREITQEAFAAATFAIVKRINKAGEAGDWRADAFLLERRLPERWGRRVVQHEGNADKPLRIEVVWGGLPVDEPPMLTGADDAQSSDDTD